MVKSQDCDLLSSASGGLEISYAVFILFSVLGPENAVHLLLHTLAHGRRMIGWCLCKTDSFPVLIMYRAHVLQGRSIGACTHTLYSELASQRDLDSRSLWLACDCALSISACCGFLFLTLHRDRRKSSIETEEFFSLTSADVQISSGLTDLQL